MQGIIRDGYDWLDNRWILRPTINVQEHGLAFNPYGRAAFHYAKQKKLKKRK